MAFGIDSMAVKLKLGWVPSPVLYAIVALFMAMPFLAVIFVLFMDDDVAPEIPKPQGQKKV